MSRQENIAAIRTACELANGPKFLLSVDVPPVNLADVLLALQSSREDNEIAVLQDGRFAVRTERGLNIFHNGCWNLQSNCLEEQSGETLELIASLLKR